MPIQIRLLGGLCITDGEIILTRFGTRKPDILLARLAYGLHRAHPREELMELLWSDEDPLVTRARFKQVLTELRRSLSALGTAAKDILIADRTGVRLNGHVVSTDVSEFESGLRSASFLQDPSERARTLTQAIERYAGDLLPGHYDAWIGVERLRLADLHAEALCDLARCLGEIGEIGKAVETAKRAVSADPLREQSHCELMRLYAADGRTAEALRQFGDLQRILRTELGMRPSPESEILGGQLRDGSLNLRYRRPAPDAPRAPMRHDDSQAAPTTIQVPLTRFFGRQQELASLERMLSPQNGSRDSERLVTITGTGGSGKTRLAVEAARRLSEAFAGRAWFVPLAEITESHHIADAILMAIGLDRSVSRDPWTQVIEALSDRPCLLALDNFEQLVASSALQVRDLIQRAPQLRCLITSRQPLKLEGERELPIEPLPTPSTPGTPDRLLEFASVQLFADRAQAVRPDFEVTPTNAHDVAILCHRLDGIPLAIELAAARSPIFTPAQMVGQLDHRFEFLRNRNQDAVDRHKTLRATIDWSYRLLEPELQTLFARLSIFRGGCTLRAATEVGAWDVNEETLLCRLEELRDRSLLTGSEAENEMRLGMLETLREYAAERLNAAERDDLCRRHAAYFLLIAEEAEPHLAGADQTRWFRMLELDLENFRAALSWTFEGRDKDAERVTLGLRIASALNLFWHTRGLHTEGRNWLSIGLAIDRVRVGSHDKARALKAAGGLASSQGDYKIALDQWQAALRLYRRRKDRAGIATMLHNLGNVSWKQNDLLGARRRLNASLAIRRELGDNAGIAAAMNVLGIIARRRGEFELARRHYEQCLSLFHEVGDQGRVASTMTNLGNVMTHLGDYERARELHTESLAMMRSLGQNLGIVAALDNLAQVLLALNELQEAEVCFKEALTVASEIGARPGIAETLEGLARVRHAGLQSRDAARLLGAAAALRAAILFPVPQYDRDRYAKSIESVRSDLGVEVFEAVWRDGAAMTLDSALRFALTESAALDLRT